jgi:hypothetical protein
MTAGAPAATLPSMTAVRSNSATWLRTPVADVIHEPVITLSPRLRAALVHAPLSDAVRLMDERNATHLVVVDRERPVGVTSTLDVAGAAAWGRK